MRRRILMLAVPAALALPPREARAHGVQYRVLEQPGTTVAFAYGDGSPMAFASMRIWAPGAAEQAVQAGRTDREGRVTFRPDRDGAWRIEVRDEEGHQVNAVIDIASGTARAQADSLPIWLGAVSLALNAVAAAFLVQHVAERRSLRRIAPGRVAG